MSANNLSYINLYKLQTIWPLFLIGAALSSSLYCAVYHHHTLLVISIVILAVAGVLQYFTSHSKTKMLQESSDKLFEANLLLESRLKAMELTLDGIFIVNQAGKLRYMNLALMDLHGITPEASEHYIDKDWLELYPLDVQSDIQSTLADHMYNHNNWTGEVRLGNADHKTIELSLTKLPDGGLIGTSHDITERKKASAKNEQLQSQFYQAQKMEAVGRLAGGIAHDFNNILAAINGYAEFLIEDLADRPAEQKFATKILGAAQQAKKLVDQILTFSRRNDSKSENIDIIPVMYENISMIAAGSGAGVEIKYDIQLANAMINGNTSQLSQAIMNLCVNAIDAMENERGRLSITVQAAAPKDLAAYADIVQDNLPDPSDSPIVEIKSLTPIQTMLLSGAIAKDRDYIHISIADTGTGMSRPVIEHVFEPFFTTKAVNKGTGLGLSTVHGVMTQHQGAISIDSILGVGTTFHLFLPLSQSENDNKAEPIEDLARFEYEGARILLVEDQPEVRDMTSRMLLRMGFVVIESETGLDALDVLKKQQEINPFDLVLTDHAMPKMTGLEFILQAAPDYPDLPFILLSGYSEEKLQDFMRENDAIKAVLRKPIKKQALKDAIYTVLAKENAVIETDIDPVGTAA